MGRVLSSNFQGILQGKDQFTKRISVHAVSNTATTATTITTSPSVTSIATITMPKIIKMKISVQRRG